MLHTSSISFQYLSCMQAERVSESQQLFSVKLIWNVINNWLFKTTCILSLFTLFKASELQAWLLYYGLPCLIGYLPDKYLLHFGHLAEGIFILLGDAITPFQLNRAKDLLHTFYRDFQSLYGESMRYCGNQLCGSIWSIEVQCIRYATQKTYILVRIFFDKT